MDAKMGFSFRPRADMPGMQMGLVDDLERLGSERSLQLAFDFANDLHLSSFKRFELARPPFRSKPNRTGAESGLGRLSR